MMWMFVTASQILSYVKNDQVKLRDLTALIQILKNVFDNPNRVRDAENKLFTIDQKTRNFSAYFTKFQRYVAEII
jgi:hypothetical protein